MSLYGRVGVRGERALRFIYTRARARAHVTQQPFPPPFRPFFPFFLSFLLPRSSRIASGSSASSRLIKLLSIN